MPHAIPLHGICVHYNLQSQLLWTKEALAFGELGQEEQMELLEAETTRGRAAMPGIIRDLALSEHLLLLGFNLQYRTVIAKPESLSTCQNLHNYFVP